MNIEPTDYLAILFDPTHFRVGRLREQIGNMSPVYIVEGRAFNRLSFIGAWSWLDYYEKEGQAVGLHVSAMTTEEVPDYLKSVKNVELSDQKYWFNIWFVDDHDAELIPIQIETHEYYADESGFMLALFDTRWYRDLLRLDNIPTFEMQRPSLSFENVQTW